MTPCCSEVLTLVGLHGVVQGGLSRLPRAETHHGLGHGAEVGERLGDLGLLAHGGRGRGVGDDEGGVEEVGRATRDPRRFTHQLDRVLVRVLAREGAGQLDDRSGGETGERGGHGADRPGPRQPQDVLARDDLAEQVGGRAAQLLAQRGRMALGGVDHQRVAQPERLLQPAGQVDVDGTRVTDLDPHQTARARRLDQPGDLEPAELELLGDVDLGPAVDVVAPGDGGREHELGRPAVEVSLVHLHLLLRARATVCHAHIRPHVGVPVLRVVTVDTERSGGVHSLLSIVALR